jgi:membrane protease YdiL (CAAX protease family)
MFVSGNENAINILSDVFFVQVLQIFLSSLMFTLPFIFVFRKFKEKIGDLVSFSKPRAKRSLPLFLFGIGFCAFANVASSAIETIFEKLGFVIKSVEHENPEGIFGFLIVFVSTAVVPALVEEFACRGLIMGLLKKHGEGFAIIASSVLFGLIHGNFEQIPFAFMVGLALGFICIKAESLWPSVAVHFFNNLSAVVFSYLPFSANLINIIYTVFYSLCMLLGLLGILLLRNDKEIFTLKRDGQVVSEKKKYIYFFTCAPIIITIIYNLIEAVVISVI